MELKGKQVEDFVKAIEESERMNKESKDPFKAYDSMGVKEINAIYIDPIEPIIRVVDDVELEEFKERLQKQSTLKVNPKLIKECKVTIEWVKEDESDNEEEVPVTVVEVIKKCECGGEFEYIPEMTQTLEYPPHYTHTCNKCGKKEIFLQIYPYQKYKRIKTGHIQD